MDSEKGEVFQYPDCWEDDVKMNSLFTPFRPRNINPNNYDSKMSFWSSLIEKWCLHHKMVVVDINALNEGLKRKDKTPSCLPDVIAHLQNNKILIRKEAFYQMVQQSWLKWAFQVLVTNPLSMVKNKILQCTNNTLLHMSVIEKLGQELVQKVPSDQREKLLDASDVKIISGINNMESLEIVLYYLCYQKLVALHQTESTLLVKFPKDGSTNPTIRNMDKALYSLEQTKILLEKNMERLNNEKKQAIEEARKYVAAKEMEKAKASLRRSKKLQRIDSNLSFNLTNINMLIWKMSMVQIDSKVMDVYKSSIQSIKEFMIGFGLTKESVMKTRDELEEILLVQTDIDEAVSKSLDSEEEDVTDEALESELMNLLKDDTSGEDAILAKLPDVPEYEPGIQTTDKLREMMAGMVL